MFRRVVLALLMVSLAAPGTTAATTFSNPTPIVLQPFVGTAGPLLPYPSVIDVNGQTGTVASAQVTLSGIAYEDVDELEVVVVGPSGARTLLMNAACNGLSTIGSPATFTFDDAAAAPLPSPPPCPSGTYKPSSYSASTGFLPPAPPGPHPGTFSEFIGTQPDGIWSLYANDHAVGGGGSIGGGWNLDLTMTPVAAATKKCKKGFRLKKVKGKKKRKCVRRKRQR